MSRVVTYANNKYQCFCQIRLDNGERILISIANAPSPNVKIVKLFLGFWPLQTIWEYNPTMAGGYDAYIRKLVMMFCGPFASEQKHPLDTFRDRLLPCKSITEVRNSLFEAERSIHNEGKQIINPGESGEKDFDPTWGNMLHKYGNDPDADVAYDAMLARQKAGDELRSIAIEREANSNVMSDEDRKKAQIREQIISEYGSYIEKNPPSLEFRDISELPYPKEQILDAISLEIVRENNDLRIELLKVFAEMLANFQENVGPTPVTTLGISDTELIAAARMSSTATGRGDFSEVKDFALKFAAKIANNPDKEKYELLRKVADEELVSIQSRLMAAEELSRQMPEAKKRQILG